MKINTHLAFLSGMYSCLCYLGTLRRIGFCFTLNIYARAIVAYSPADGNLIIGDLLQDHVSLVQGAWASLDEGYQYYFWKDALCVALPEKGECHSHQQLS